MIHSTKRKLIIYSIIISMVLPCYSIQRRTARFVTVIWAGLCGGASYKGYPLVQDKVHPAIFGVTSVIATLGMYNYLYAYTPQGILKNANSLLNEVCNSTLAKHSFNSNASFFNTLHDAYLTHDLPLISAYNHLATLVPTVYKAFALIHKASRQIGTNKELQYTYRRTALRAKNIFTNISRAIKRIRMHKDYLPQLRIYKEFLASDKQAQAQEKMAHAQMQIAHAQQSSTFLKWLKTLLR